MAYPIIAPVQGTPGVGTETRSIHRQIFRGGTPTFRSGGELIAGADARDPGNTPDVGHLRAGHLMGLVTASNMYGSSVIGTLDAAYDGSTSATLDTLAEATELVRRQGASGTFKLTGPPTSGGTVRTLTVTYSAVNTTSTGVATVTALSTAAVWTLTPISGTDGGTFKLKVTLPDGSAETTASISFNATGATFQAAIDSALEALTIFDDDAVTVASTDTTGVSVMTFSSVYGALQVEIVDDRLTDGSVFLGEANLVETTPGVDGRFIAGSFVQPTDGSEVVRTFLPDDYPSLVVDDSGTGVNYPWDRIPIAGEVDSSMLLPWPSDTSLRAWIKSSLNSYGQFVFDHDY